MTAVEVKNITKTFPGVKALSDVSLSITKGEVHAIVGENGAGKSTLMKILGGLYSADTGEIFIDGVKKDIRSINDSLNAGVSVIYQEFNLMPELTVAENIYITDLPKTSMGILDIRKLNADAKKIIESMNLKLKATDFVSLLSVSQQQMVEIAKALSRNAQIIVMDEPTASLNDKEVETLYEIIKELKAQGKTILYISHRLKEIFDLCDSVSVLRDGCFVATKSIKELTTESLVNLMVGREVSQYFSHTESKPGKVVLDVQGLTREGLFKDVNFTVRAGELVGMAGLMGCGREEIVKSIYGLIGLNSGKIMIDDKVLKIKKPRDAIKHKIGFVTEDRKDAGIFSLMTVRENITMNILKTISKLGLISDKREEDLLLKFTKGMNMKYSSRSQRIMFLSGGNQQKFVLARALAADCKVLILLEPTRGIDVGAKAEIYTLLGDLAAQGIAILVISSELPEIMAICHRTLVVYQGDITGDIPKDKMNESLIMQCATGNQRYFEGGDAQ